MPPVLTTRPLGFRPSPPTIAELYFCIQAYQAPCKACISSGEGLARFSVDSRKMNKYFAMMVLQNGLAHAGGGLSAALCDYNEQAATVRTLTREKNLGVPILEICDGLPATPARHVPT